jgi:hypothetical protein
VERPWLTICSTLPSRPSGERANIPSITNPRWLTEEYAMSFFMSFWTRVTRPAYTIPMMERVTTN